MHWLRNLFIQLAAAIIGLWLAQRFLPGVEIQKGAQFLILAGLVLGGANYFIKPIFKKITWPIRLLTLGLFSFVINMAIIWAVDILFPELIIPGLISLFWTTVIIWGLGLALPLLIPKKKIISAEE